MIQFLPLLMNTNVRWLVGVVLVAIGIYAYHQTIVSGLERDVTRKDAEISQLTTNYTTLYNSTLVQNAEIERLHETTIKYGDLLEDASKRNNLARAASEKRIYDLVNRKQPIPKDCDGAVSVMKESIRDTAKRW